MRFRLTQPGFHGLMNVGQPGGTMRVLTLLSVLALLGCAEPTGPVNSELLVADARQGTVRLANRTREPVYYFVVERDFAALALFAACTDPATCAKVPARGTIEVDYDDVAGYKAGAAEAIVLHYRLVAADGGGFRPDSVRALVIPLN